MLFVANGLRAGGCFAFILSSQGTVEVFVLVRFLASLGPFVGPAESALVPTLVRRENLTAANASLNLMRYVAQIAGLVVLAPLLVRAAGIDALFITTGALFAGSAVYSALIPMGVVMHDDATDLELPDEEARPRAKGLREAWDFLRDNRAVWQAVVQLALLAALLPLLLALTPVYVTEALDQKVSELPVVVFPAIVGMLAVCVWFPAWPGPGKPLGWARRDLPSSLPPSLRFLLSMSGRRRLRIPSPGAAWTLA